MASAARSPKPTPTPTPTPTPALTQVTHDSTLSGNGTAASPLGVSSSFTIAGANVTGNIAAGQINGTLTNATISGNNVSGTVPDSTTFSGHAVEQFLLTTSPLSGGQITNGSITSAKLALEVKPLRILDSVGNEVGVLVGAGGGGFSILRYLASDNTWLRLDLNATDFFENINNAMFYESSDCSGTAYFTRGAEGFYAEGYVFQGVVYYGAQVAPTQKTLQSAIQFGGQCQGFAPFTDPVVPVSTRSTSSFGTPPFQLVR